MRIHGPERLGGQGLDPEQEESGNRAILALLADPEVAEQTDLVLTWRAGDGDEPGAYEVWSARGLVRFRRVLADDGRVEFEVLEVVGENPLANQDPHALRTLAEEKRAAAASGFSADDPARRFIGPAQQSYPFAYERVAQLFDSPNAPDLAVSPRDWCSGVQPGTHGGLHVRQSRAPLWLSGPGVRRGVHELAARAVDIAPTCLAALGFPKVDGADASGRTASERGKEEDVYLARQDGRVLEEILEPGAKPAKRLYIFLLDGMHPTELEDRLARDPAALPALRRLRERAAVLASGQVVTFPSITWPSHTTIGTGTWCGHHDVVNPTYYLREKRETVSPQGQQMRTEGFANGGVESLAEAFHRVRPGCMTAAIHAPFGRSARHAVLEGRNLGDRARLKALTLELAADQHPRWKADGFEGVLNESVLDTRGLAQVIELFTREDLPPPDFVYHELTLTDGAGHDYGPHDAGLRDALDESDRRIGRVLDLLGSLGLLEETLFVVSADHGMAPQDVALRANPAWHVARSGMEAVVAEPMIWLRDLALEVERAPDGRTARVFVRDNDALPSGEKPGVEGAEVSVEGHREGEAPVVLARGTTGEDGVFGFATPSDLASEHIGLAVRAPGRNPRHVRLDGRRLALDLRTALYGVATPDGR
jgi:phosphonoacetate hydrolase